MCYDAVMLNISKEILRMGKDNNTPMKLFYYYYR